MANERIAWIDALRVLAALLVVGFHVMYEFEQNQSFRAIGFQGASLFFILSGFSLAMRNPELASFSFDWLKRRYLRIAIVYYPALIAVYALFTSQVAASGLYAIFMHFIFLDFLDPSTVFSIISPAWFLVPLMALYVVFPYLNRMIRWNPWTILVVFFAAAAFRHFDGGWVSFNPLFFLGEFCFGIAMAHGFAAQSFAGAVLSLFPNPVMALPYAIFALFSRINFDCLAPLLSGIGKRSLEIFLFHESVMKSVLGKWRAFGLDMPLSPIVTLAALGLVMLVSSELEKRLLKRL